MMHATTVEQTNQMPDEFSERALTGSVRDYRDLHGSDLLARVKGFFQWQDQRRGEGLWPYSKSVDAAPTTATQIRDDRGQAWAGVNFASQDYLGLSSHPRIRDAAHAAIEEFGAHSAGSAVLLGNTKISDLLIETIAEHVACSDVVLYPTGWAAGFGVIKALIRPTDHIVMDGLSHACLQEGAAAATPNIHLHGHLKLDSARRILKRIRAHDSTNAILVITETLFSMNSDTPEIRGLQDLCHEYGAYLLVDAAHDLGAIGKGGHGFLGEQGMLGEVDLVMGSFSKTFASNGGFIAVNSRPVREYLKYFSGPHTFSNALSPIQAAVVLEAFRIVRSPIGDELRSQLMRNVLTLRTQLTEKGLTCMGIPSAIVPVPVGEEGFARVVSKLLPQHGALMNLVEFPAVPKGNARFRLQVMATHTRAEINVAADALHESVQDANSQFDGTIDDPRLHGCQG